MARPKNKVITEKKQNVAYGDIRPGCLFRRPQGTQVYMKTDRTIHTTDTHATRTAVSLASGYMLKVHPDSLVLPLEPNEKITIIHNERPVGDRDDF